MTTLSSTHDDPALIEYGMQRLDWTRSRMLMLADVRERFIKQQSFREYAHRRRSCTSM